MKKTEKSEKPKREDFEYFQDYIIAAYPSLIEDVTQKNGEVVKSIPCGACCPKAWEPILDNLCSSIVWHMEHNRRRIYSKGLHAKFNSFVRGIARRFSNFLYHYVDPDTRKYAPPERQDTIIKWKDRSWVAKFSAKMMGHVCSRFSAPYKLEESDPVKIAQIKEKFGTLRFYYSGGDQWVDGATSFAESLTETVCFDCGTNQDISQNGYYFYCPTCLDRFRERQKESNRKWKKHLEDQKKKRQQQTSSKQK